MLLNHLPDVLPINSMLSYVAVTILNSPFYVSYVSVYVQSITVLFPDMSYVACSYLLVFLHNF